jgi:hypothetical protein
MKMPVDHIYFSFDGPMDFAVQDVLTLMRGKQGVNFMLVRSVVSKHLLPQGLFSTGAVNPYAFGFEQCGTL